jgi:hypothetical protein
MAKAAMPLTEEQLAKISIKAQKERDAEEAMRAYRLEQAAVLERTLQLRAMRLARDSKLAAAAARTPIESAQPVKKPKKVAGVRLARSRT